MNKNKNKNKKSIFLHIMFALFGFCFLVGVFCFQITGAHEHQHDEGSQDADKVGYLPGVGKTVSQQYSGYLKVSRKKYYHYLFVESQNNPANDPVVLWLNGGPGCSSLDGYLEELGPYFITGCSSRNNCTLKFNQYSWTKIANIIFLESPVGVGFSTLKNAYEVAHNDDESTSLDNLEAVIKWFQRFSQYRLNEFFIVGESYAGIYVPMLVDKIHEYNKNAEKDLRINLKAFAVGNGLHSWRYNQNTMQFFANYHGMISSQQQSDLMLHCCPNGHENIYKCNFYDSQDVYCNITLNSVQETIDQSGFNDYSIYDTCYHDDSNNCVTFRRRNEQRQSLMNIMSKSHIKKPKANLMGLNLLQNFAKLKSKPNSKAPLNIDEGKEEVTVCKDGSTVTAKSDPNLPCVSTYEPETYFNMPEVRDALNIDSQLFDYKRKWSLCTENKYFEYNRRILSIMDYYKNLIKHYRILIYNGDTDFVCNFLSARVAFENTFNLTKFKNYKPQHADTQWGGFYEQYDNLTLLTVSGSGHMVPGMQKAKAYHMFYNFINDLAYDNDKF